MASLARRTLWLTDAYFAGTSSYVQALRSAAQDGVDVRLLVPGAGSDIPMMQAVSRAGYRALLEAGIRVLEWNGSMLHAKTAVADARWARVGSTNLNLASWVGNRELDVVVENAAFGRRMAEMFQEDIANATEIVLHRWARVRPAGDVRGAPVRGAGGERDAHRGRRAAYRQRPRVRLDGEAGPRFRGALADGGGAGSCSLSWPASGSCGRACWPGRSPPSACGSAWHYSPAPHGGGRRRLRRVLEPTSAAGRSSDRPTRPTRRSLTRAQAPPVALRRDTQVTERRSLAVDWCEQK